MDLTIPIALVIIILTSIYIYVKRQLTYWQRHGVPTIAPIRFLIGNLLILNGNEQVNHALRRIYQQLKGRGAFGGLYIFTWKIALAIDLDFIKNVLIKDFHHFNDRGVYFNEIDDPLSAHLFAINHDKWHRLRNKLSPTFTSGKMKFMFPTIINVANKFCITLDNMMMSADEKSIDLEVRDLMARFTTDVIGTCAFGIECNSLDNPNAEFRQMGRKIFDNPRHHLIIQILVQSFPKVARMFGVKVLRDEVSEFFMNIVRETVNLRESQQIKRNDFMDILIELKNQEKDSLSLEEIAAQAFLFFLGGFETSSSTLQYVFYELALNMDIQEKLRNEIHDVIEKHDGKFTYEAMISMPYLDQVLNETLRKHPPFGVLIREVTQAYKVPGTDVTLPVGCSVFIPSYAIQHDEEHFPEPERFRPERFSPKEMAQRNSITFLTFGDGPRNCVGLRFGMMQMRVAVVKSLLEFEFLKCPKTPERIVHEKRNPVMVPDGGMWLKIKKL